MKECNRREASVQGQANRREPLLDSGVGSFSVHD